jgi:hypothetical protein
MSPEKKTNIGFIVFAVILLGGVIALTIMIGTGQLDTKRPVNTVSARPTDEEMKAAIKNPLSVAGA